MIKEIFVSFSFILFCNTISVYAGGIHDVVKNGDLKALEIMLSSSPNLVFSRDEVGNVPLDYSNGNETVAEKIKSVGEKQKREIQLINPYANYIPSFDSKEPDYQKSKLVFSPDIKTHCWVVGGEKRFMDSRFVFSSSIINSAPLKGNCLLFPTWEELYKFFNEIKSSIKLDHQFFITQAVHGAPGGRALDKDISHPDPQCVADLGGTSPIEVIPILLDISGYGHVAFHNMSCYGGSMVTKYIQQLQNPKELDSKVRKRLPHLCIATDSVQGVLARMREPGMFPSLQLSGKSITELFKEDIKAINKSEPEPVIHGLISAATLSVPDQYKQDQCRSPWEDGQYPMVIHRSASDMTHVLNAFHGASLIDGWPHKIYGDGEQIYRNLDKPVKHESSFLFDENQIVHKASIESLDVPASTELQQLLRQACDDFRF